jgi:hypothetical protein
MHPYLLAGMEDAGIGMIAYTEKRIDLRRLRDGDKKSSPRAAARQDPFDAAHVSTDRVLIDGGDRHMQAFGQNPPVDRYAFRDFIDKQRHGQRRQGFGTRAIM